MVADEADVGRASTVVSTGIGSEAILAGRFELRSVVVIRFGKIGRSREVGDFADLMGFATEAVAAAVVVLDLAEALGDFDGWFWVASALLALYAFSLSLISCPVDSLAILPESALARISVGVISAAAGATTCGSLFARTEWGVGVFALTAAEVLANLLLPAGFAALASLPAADGGAAAAVDEARART